MGPEASWAPLSVRQGYIQGRPHVQRADRHVPSVAVASQRLYLCPRSTDSVHQDCRPWPTLPVSGDCRVHMSVP